MNLKLILGAAMLASTAIPAHAELIIVSLTTDVTAVATASYNGVTSPAAKSTLAAGSSTAEASASNLADASDILAQVNTLSAVSSRTTGTGVHKVSNSASGENIAEIAEASLGSAASGSVSFSGKTTASTSSTFAAAFATAAGKDATLNYKFIATNAVHGTIIINWSNVFASTSGAWNIAFNGVNRVVDVVAGKPALSGSTSFALNGNGANELKISEVGNLDFSGVVGKIATASGAQAADFNWSITGVPEVSTWSMMLAGFASLAFVGFGRNQKVRLIGA